MFPDPEPQRLLGSNLLDSAGVLLTSVILEGKMRLSALKADFMRIEQFTSHMEVSLTPEETLGLLEGRSVGDRPYGTRRLMYFP